MSLKSEILNEALALQKTLTGWRRHLHAYPETGLDVPETAEYIRKILKKMNIPFLADSPYGSVIACLKGDPNGEPMALRADMDALGIPEMNSIDYRSRNDGRMHACGHDGHMAMLLGAAEILSRRELPQDTYLVFQPGEEGPGGAEPIMESRLLQTVRGIFAIHLDPTMPTGSAGINRGRAMAATDNFFITIKGRGGHAGLPHKTVDPIAISAQIINSFQFIVSRLIDPVHPAVITVGTIQGGFMPNAIAEEVKISGTIRTFSQDIRLQIRKELEETTRMFCQRYGGEFQLKVDEEYPALVNSDEMVTYFTETARGLEESINTEILSAPRMTSEDFSYYLMSIPGAFYWLGCSSGEESSYPLHHSRFNMDESALPLGVTLHSLCVLNFQNR